MDVQPFEEHARRVEEAARFIGEAAPFPPDVVVMLGTGLGGVAQALEGAWRCPYGSIPYFPVSTAPDHRGELQVGRIGEARVAVFQGRFHYYEGYSTLDLALPVRVMASLGAKVLVGCNAAGGLDLSFRSGDIMLIEDHINLIPENPLRGPNLEHFGPRFPDMSRAYSSRLRGVVEEIAAGEGIALRSGVFVCVPGPSLETPAETRFLRMIGGDAVAMSLVPEVIAAVHAGMEVVGLSIIANVNDPDNFQPILIEDVIEQAQRAEERLQRLIAAFLRRYPW